MRLDINKLDERIRRLQEIRRLIADPETAALLLELVAPEEQQPSVVAPKTDDAVSPSEPDERDLLLKEMAAGGGETQGGSGLWGIRRR